MPSCAKAKISVHSIGQQERRYPPSLAAEHTATGGVQEPPAAALFPLAPAAAGYGGGFQLHNRRYVGSKHKLIDWIFSIIREECPGTARFADIFSGTGAVAAAAGRQFGEVVINDFLYSNNIIYKAFFGTARWRAQKIQETIRGYRFLNPAELEDNYFSLHFGGKYFSRADAKIIGFIREDIEARKAEFTARERDILLASLLYSADKIANTVGHYDAYFKRDNVRSAFRLQPIAPLDMPGAIIHREDANALAEKIQTDIAYIDPPYNSRQYSRFYHILENLTKWEKPPLHGTALKPAPENMSDYCRTAAKGKFAKLVADLDARYLVVSYNNTYNSKSNSSQNKIRLEEMEGILRTKGETKVFETDYRHFNAGNTAFSNHKEYLFVTRTSRG